MSIQTRPMQHLDWPSVRSIYQQGIATGLATFEVNVPSWDEWDQHHLSFCRLIAEDAGVIVGWAALSLVSHRAVYSGVAEESVYIAENARGKGIGKIFLQQLISESEQNGIWTLQAIIFPEQKVSIALHESFVYLSLVYREKIGKLDGVCYDILLMDRRSLAIGFS